MSEPIWPQILKKLLEMGLPGIDQLVIENWLEICLCDGIANRKLKLVAQTGIVRDRVQNELAEGILQAVQTFDWGKNVIRVEVQDDPRRCFPRDEDCLAESPANNELTAVAVQVKSTVAGLQTRTQDKTTVSYPEFTFGNLIEGPGNRYARALALEMPERQTKEKLVLVYGKPGSGKTHLLQATHKEALARAQDKSHIISVSAQEFTDEFMVALGQKKMLEFGRKYDRCKFLIFDEVQLLAGRDKTQETLIGILDKIQEKGGRVLIASLVHPKDVKLDPSLKSRLCGFNCEKIEPPPVELKEEILNLHISRSHLAENLWPSAEIVSWIAREANGDARFLLGLLKRVLSHIRLDQKPLSLKEVQELLSDTMPNPVDCLLIKKVVASHYGATVEALHGPGRNKLIARPRQVAMYLCRKFLPGESLAKIGEQFGKRDHTTVVAAIKVITDILANGSGQDELVSEKDSLVSDLQIIERRLRD